MGPRKRVFSDEVMTRLFKETHEFTMGRDSVLPKMGYPDMGAGYFARRLPYKDWFEFNCA